MTPNAVGASASPLAAAQRGYGRRYRGRDDRGMTGLILGAVGATAAGGAIGVALSENSCHCENPALHGFLIGAPIGALRWRRDW